jgi:hypothetical protein
MTLDRNAQKAKMKVDEEAKKGKDETKNDKGGTQPMPIKK